MSLFLRRWWDSDWCQLNECEREKWDDRRKTEFCVMPLPRHRPSPHTLATWGISALDRFGAGFFLSLVSADIAPPLVMHARCHTEGIWLVLRFSIFLRNSCFSFLLTVCVSCLAIPLSSGNSRNSIQESIWIVDSFTSWCYNRVFVGRFRLHGAWLASLIGRGKAWCVRWY